MEHLLDACLTGDRKAQEALYRQMSPILFGLCKRYLTKREDAEEVLSNAFVKIFTKLESFEKKGSFEGWMKKITVRECLNFLRSKQDAFDLDWSGEVAAATENSDEAAFLLALIQSMPTGYRTVFNLYAIEGYSHEEIASLLSISKGTSKSQLSKARNYLKQQLPEYRVKQL
ncbi:RNA polymerase sigma factor [Schleiferiaceae bacterium]|jgi:RNA polymerase sigma-70 factor (ECF subfamily)|nr:RNA polymerase sigma factor [Schleiferiaceae bacterium]